MTADIGLQLVKLRREKARLESELERVKAKIAELDPRLLDWFTEVGMDRGTWDGMTLTQRRELWASVPAGADVGKIKASLRRAGVDPAAIFKEGANTQTLSALIREMERSDKGIPPALQKNLKISEVFKVGFTDNGSQSRPKAA